MKLLIEQFPDQIRDAIEIAEQTRLRAHDQPIRNVVITGLGGSGIGGTISSELAIKESPLPIQVSKGYFIPGWVDAHTLVIVSSYSGNTEETIHAMELAQARKAKLVCITSGGKIAEKARAENLDLVLLPGGNPPRACLGYSLIQQLYTLHHFGALPRSPREALVEAAALIEAEQAAIVAEAQRLSAFLAGKIPVIYATTYLEGLAIRLRQQINENAKMLCWHHVIPEMNHNELVGWRIPNDNLAVLFLRDPDDYPRNAKRIEINSHIISNYTPHLSETFAKGQSAIAKAMYLIHLGDWISWFLAEKRAVDATEVNVIDYLKGELSKL